RAGETDEVLALRRADHFDDLVLAHRLREQEALQLVTACSADETMLFLRLDAFGGDCKSERTSEPRDAFDDRGRFFGHAEVLHERLVDLNLVDWEAAQITERGIAGTEIVEHDPNAHLAHFGELAEHFRRRVQKRAFGDLDLEPA